MYELIRASAGSGKTFQLSGHFLRQLFLGYAPETILATTFTRKAAGEILGRVLLRLADAAENSSACDRLAEFLKPVPVTQEKAAELLVQVTHRLHRMRVCTLDSFFQQVARSLTLELSLPPGWGIVDDHIDRDLRQQAVDAVLAQQIPRDAQRLMQMLAKGHSKRSVRDLIDRTVSTYHELFLQTDASAWQKIPTPTPLTRKQIEESLRHLAWVFPDADGRMASAIETDRALFVSEKWDEFLSKGLAKKILEEDFTYYKKPISEGIIEAYQPLIQHAQAELLLAVARQTKATYELIDRFDREYRRLRAEHGWMGFGDVTRVLAHAGEAASGQRMNFRLDSTLQNLLLDEFQDTSPDQWKVLRRLALKIASEPDRSSFFCVGDPKQAIYGWRGGVAEILDVVENTMPTIHSSSLDKSRRSSRAVILAVNKVFKHLHQHGNLNDSNAAALRWETQFPVHSTVHDDIEGYVQLRTSPVLEGDSADERRSPFYSWAALQIQELHRQCPGAEIGVLTRKNETVARLVHELKLLKVPASEEGGTPPTDSPAVLALMSLLHLCSHPGCQISRFHVANSPLAGLVELTTWTDDLAAANTASEIRNRLMDDGYGPTLQWISEAVRPFCHQRDILRLQQVVAQGWQFDQTPSLNPADFVSMLESSRLSKSEAAPVRVMTVHQSKGLEFDIVVLPELDSRLFNLPSAAVGSPSPAESPDRVCIWRNRTVRSLLPQNLQDAFDQTITRQASEALCVLYVALTRAKQALHMFIPPLPSDKPPASYAGLLTSSLTGVHTAAPDRTIYECGNPDWFVGDSRFVTPRQTSQPSAAALVPRVAMAEMTVRRRGLRREAPSRHAETRIQLADTRRTSADRRATAASALDPRTRGTVIHAWFELIHWLEGGIPERSDLLRLALQNNVSPHVAEELMLQFFQMLELPNLRATLSEAQTIQQPPFKALAADLNSGRAVLEVENERPFVLKRDGALVQGTIDRLVLAIADGRPVAADIIDFKTDRLTGEPREWVADRIQVYGSQLEQYRSAVHQCFGIPREHITSRLLLLEADVVVSPRTPATASRLNSH
ncbi:MAG: UvrD-helicase domain-containing protein [Planctomycetaceae bacterium]